MQTVIATEENVRAAMLEIRAEGGVPTVRKIRRRLGGGSFKTINMHRRKVLEEWEVLEQVGYADLSADIKKAIVQDRERAIEQNTAALRQMLENYRTQADEALEDLEGAEERIEELVAQKAAERVEHQQALSRLEIASARAEEKSGALEEMLRQEREKAEAALREREQLHGRIGLLQAEVNRAGEAVADARRQTGELEGQVRSATAACAAVKERAAVAEQHAKDTEAAWRAARQQCQELRRELRELQGEHRTLTGRWLDLQNFNGKGGPVGA